MEVKIPIGISDFAEIRKKNYYYIDKSGLIRELSGTGMAKVTLITRPRRFGKTLGMSMLAEFFDIRKDSRALFEGLEISRDRDICESWQNAFPTLFVSFKRVDGLNFSSAYEMLRSVITELCVDHSYLLESNQVSDYHREILKKLDYDEVFCYGISFFKKRCLVKKRPGVQKLINGIIPS